MPLVATTETAGGWMGPKPPDDPLTYSAVATMSLPVAASDDKATTKS